MRTFFLLGMLVMVTLTGCTGVMEFQKPDEFRDGKVKEDPPGTMLPVTTRVKWC